ncbi:endoplasmic reticulum oxidoreductins 1 [Prunus dulcis]|uniref:Endoplasmic reticulum oxidoreductins 1 n=1 Tax=Prunus dulcis TaxID=3755 RepID=A0A4Y1RBP5_PRUDU|nr:endoplasmic reticulum oxidoreductins 1 [Prunus dulcis]
MAIRPLLQGLAPDSFVCQEGKQQGTVDHTLDNRAFRGWVETDNPWTNDDETDNGEMTYVNLLLNPERYTGNAGPSPRRIRDAVLSIASPTPAIGGNETLKSEDSSQDICQEKKVLYKLIWSSLLNFDPHSC